MTDNAFLKAIFNPGKALILAWRKVSIGPFRLRLACDAITRPHYAYCMYYAAFLAHRLDHKKMSVIEFGVAGGNGLIAMEKIASEIESEWPVDIEIYGFDTGAGLPASGDYRDLPYVFRAGDYPMDVAKLRSRLSRASLILGDVKDTVPRFVESHSPAPIGFIAIDVDLYSSTVDALKVLDGGHETRLPRVYCYFDDTVGRDWTLHNEWAGELLAIKEFNDSHHYQKIAPVHGLRHKRIIKSSWNDDVYAMHDFKHPLYNEYVGPVPTRESELST